MAVDKRKYLNAETIATLSNMQLRARMVVEGFIVGLHKSPYHGFSVEFAEHRAYGPGDDLRYLDWRLYGKTDRFYVKQFEEETNLKAHLMLDVSRSMTYGSGEISKLQYGSYLAAALTYLLLRQQDAVGLTLFSEEIQTHVRPSSRPSMLNNLLGMLENVEPAGETMLGSCLHRLAERIHRRGLVILISDLLDEVDPILNGFKHFRHDRHEVEHEKIGIPPLFFDHAFYCKNCGGMASAKTCPHSSEYHVFLSGARVREMLKNGELPPPEFTRPEVAELLMKVFQERK